MSKTLSQQVGHRIKVRRVYLNMKQAELGRTIGIAQCYISQLERGERNLSLTQLEKIAQALHCSVLDLMDPERKVA